MTTTYLVNRRPSTTINLKTPKEMWTSDLVDYSNIRTFDYLAFTHQSEGKLEPRVIKYALLGYP